MILFHDVKGAVQLGLGKDMSMYVSTCASYDFSALMPALWKLWH
jgi:hypothetical protein